MALIRLDHTPETVKLCIPLYLILPDPGRMADAPLQERKVLYLLHGLSDDGSSWVRFSSIETVARDYGLVVVDLGIVNQDGKESTPGEATVALPFRGGKPVPYPFVPPAERAAA